MALVPERLGKYRVTGVLGEGAMGVVYKGFDPGIERTVALKTMRRQLHDDDARGDSGWAERFRNEAQAAGRLMHPGIVAVYDYGEASTSEGELAYIAMEFVEGESLEQRLAGPASFAPGEAAGLVSQLLDALGHAHALGVWHRDIKPANLLVTREGRLKIADFGIARIESVSLTRTGMMIGTPRYMAPEQLLGGEMDHRVDLYASGVLLYLLLTRRLPFDGPMESLMYRVVHEPPVLPGALPGHAAGARFDGVLARALAKRAADRYSDAAAFRQALLAAGAGTSAAVADVAVVHSDETIIVSPTRYAVGGGSGSGSTARAPSLPGGGTAASLAGASTAGWSPALLSQVETALTAHLGPLAAVLVRRTARDCSDLPGLLARLAEQLPDEAARGRLHGRGGAPGAPLPASDPSARTGTGIATGIGLRGMTDGRARKCRGHTSADGDAYRLRRGRRQRHGIGGAGRPGRSIYSPPRSARSRAYGSSAAWRRRLAASLSSLRLAEAVPAGTARERFRAALARLP